MNQYRYKDFTIEVLDEPIYEYDSGTNNFNYSKHYFSKDGQRYPSSRHGVKIFLDNTEISNCLVTGSGGATGINKNSSLVNKDQVFICCSDSVFCLRLPSLALGWIVQADVATCFQIFKLEEDYIIHGELHITRLDTAGNIKWQFSGMDIFVSIEGEEAFKLEEDHIILTDFGKTKYKIGFDGKITV